MSTENSNQPAFPSPEWVSTENRNYGLTKREMIAAICLQGMLANHELYNTVAIRIKDANLQCEFYNEAAIEQADNLLEQLNKKP